MVSGITSTFFDFNHSMYKYLVVYIRTADDWLFKKQALRGQGWVSYILYMLMNECLKRAAHYWLCLSQYCCSAHEKGTSRLQACVTLRKSEQAVDSLTQ